MFYLKYLLVILSIGQAFEYDETHPELQKLKSDSSQKLQEFIQNGNFTSKNAPKIASMDWTPHHPRVQAVDPLCITTNTQRQICTVDNKTVLFDQDTVYERQDIVEIILKNSTVSCKKSDGTPCMLTFKLTSTYSETKITLVDSKITGNSIFIDSPSVHLSIDPLSSLDVSGRSYSSQGTQPKQGASYNGNGGYCGSDDTFVDKHYSSFDLLPNFNNLYDNLNGALVGSIGEANPTINVNTGGGGRIYLNIDSLDLNGNVDSVQIKANGLPEKDLDESSVGDLMGGSGGNIYINTHNVNQENNFGDGSLKNYGQISAIGGYGKNNGLGGAGGMITFGINVLNNIGFNNTVVHGGREGSGIGTNNLTAMECGSGAAGTIFWDENDVLVVSNNWHYTGQKTYLRAKMRNPTKFPNMYMPADHLYLHSGAVVEITASGVSSILFNSLQMQPLTTMIFDFTGVDDLTLYYNQHFIVHDWWTKLDFTDATGVVTMKNYDNYQNSNNLVQLNDLLFSKDFVINVYQLILNGQFNDPKESVARQTSVKIMTDKLLINPTAGIFCDNIYLYSNGSMYIEQGAKIQSTQPNVWTSPGDNNQDLYQCMPDDNTFSSNVPKLQVDGLMKYFNSQFNLTGNAITTVSQMPDRILNKWNVYILAVGTLNVQDAEITGPRIGMCSNYIVMNGTTVSATGRGGSAQQGLGAGKQISKCAGQGGAHGGNGGNGGSESSNEQIAQLCKTTFPKSYHYGKDARFEGSGGGNGEVRSDQVDTGGAGGGIIWITTPATLQIMNAATVTADGKWGTAVNYDQYGAGGGAGGSIQITTLNLKGDGYLSAKGGAGSQNGGGGGAGGRLNMNFLRSYLTTSQPQQSSYWYGTSDISGGVGGQMVFKFQGPSNGQNGTMNGAKCFPGYSGIFCTPCSIGTYKPDYSLGKCQTCMNKPPKAFYYRTGETSPLCTYQCNKYIENVDSNPDCLNAVELDIQRIGGHSGFFFILAVFLFISLIVFTMLTYKNQLLLERISLRKDVIFKEWDDATNAQVDQDNLEVLENDHKFRLRDEEIWAHTDRMYFVGNNSAWQPWVIPQDFPISCLSDKDREAVIDFIRKANLDLKWSMAEKFSYCALRFFINPLGKQLHYMIRKKKFQNLVTQMELMDDLQNPGGTQKAIRLGVSQDDYHLGYIDFLDFENTKEDWDGLKIPRNYLVGGNGTYNHPYHMDFVNDPLIKSLALIDFSFFKDKLPIFFENLNSHFARLNFYQTDHQVNRDISKIIELIEKANKSLFKHYHIKAVLCIVENQLTEIQHGVFKQKRRSFPLESIFYESFPEMFKSLLSYINSKLIQNRGEIRLVLSFKRFIVKKQVQTELRIKQMIQDTTTEQNTYQRAIIREESVLFDENDNDKEEQKVSIVDGINPSLQDTDNGATFDSQDQQLVDKSIRAFSVSVESAKAFELALRKPRRKNKHKVIEVKKYMYQAFMLFHKHMGQPVETNDFTWYFVAYSAILAVDIMLLFNMAINCGAGVNYYNFGWAYWILPPFAAFLSACFGIAAAIEGSISFLKTVGNFNVQLVIFTIPLTILLVFLNNDDPMYVIILFFILVVKCVLSGIAAQVGHIFLNPKFLENENKLKRIMKVQAKREKRRQQVLGTARVQDTNGTWFNTKANPIIYSEEDEAKMRQSLLKDIL